MPNVVTAVKGWKSSNRIANLAKMAKFPVDSEQASVDERKRDTTFIPPVSLPALFQSPIPPRKVPSTASMPMQSSCFVHVAVRQNIYQSAFSQETFIFVGDSSSRKVQGLELPPPPPIFPSCLFELFKREAKAPDIPGVNRMLVQF